MYSKGLGVKIITGRPRMEKGTLGVVRETRRACEKKHIGSVHRFWKDDILMSRPRRWQ